MYCKSDTLLYGVSIVYTAGLTVTVTVTVLTVTVTVTVLYSTVQYRYICPCNVVIRTVHMRHNLSSYALKTLHHTLLYFTGGEADFFGFWCFGLVNIYEKYLYKHTITGNHYCTHFRKSLHLPLPGDGSSN